MDRVPAFASTAVSLKIARHSVAACLPEDLRVTTFYKREGAQWVGNAKTWPVSARPRRRP